MISKDIIGKKFNSAIIKYNANFQLGYMGSSFWKQIYMLMWDEFPHTISLSSDGCYLNNEIDEYFIDKDNEEYSNEKYPHFCTFERIRMHTTLNNIVKHYGKSALVYRDGDYPVIIGDHMIVIVITNEDDMDIIVIQNRDQLSKEFVSLVAEAESDDSVDYTYIWCDGNLQDVMLSVKDSDLVDVDLELNYNDDLPHKEITDFLKSNESGMVVLHGEAGAGKSAYIKYLIHEISGRHFIVIDSADLQYISNTMLAQIFLTDKDNVIVIEDNSVEKTGSSKAKQLNNLLTIDGGIIGSNVSYKFICTYNDVAYAKTAMQNSKVKVDYEFKALSPEKTAELAKLHDVKISEGQSLTLSKIIKSGNDDYEQNVNKHKIGFGK